MVSSTAANSLNQPTLRSEFQNLKFPMENNATYHPWGAILMTLRAQSLVNPGRIQALLGRGARRSSLNSADGCSIMDHNGPL